MMVDQNQFIGGMTRFTAESMRWCAVESESAVSAVVGIIDMLLQDAKRIANLSEEALDAVHEFRQKILSLQNGADLDKDMESELNVAQQLLSELGRLTHEHEEISELASPIIRVLQFQDRITQNMRNMVCMLKIWQERRHQLVQGGHFDAEEKRALGQKFYDCTTMEEERPPLRRHFDGLPSGQNSGGDDILF